MRVKGRYVALVVINYDFDEEDVSFERLERGVKNELTPMLTDFLKNETDGKEVEVIQTYADAWMAEDQEEII